MLKKIILPVALPVPMSPLTPQARPFMLARPSAPPMTTLRGSFFHSKNAESRARGIRTRNDFLYILFIRSIVLFSCESQKVPEP